MGYSEDIMYDFAMKDLRTVFPEYEGWKGKETPAGELNEKIYTFSRRSRGRPENAMVMVLFNRIGDTIDIDSFFTACEKTPDCTRKLILVPGFSHLQVPPGTIEVKEMTTFGYQDGNLIWLTKKKNAFIPSAATPGNSC